MGAAAADWGAARGVDIFVAPGRCRWQCYYTCTVEGFQGHGSVVHAGMYSAVAVDWYQRQYGRGVQNTPGCCFGIDSHVPFSRPNEPIHDNRGYYLFKLAQQEPSLTQWQFMAEECKVNIVNATRIHRPPRHRKTSARTHESAIFCSCMSRVLQKN